jgi:hypothetical protein
MHLILTFSPYVIEGNGTKNFYNSSYNVIRVIRLLLKTILCQKRYQYT